MTITRKIGVLYLDNNEIIGKIPDSIGRLQNLSECAISSSCLLKSSIYPFNIYKIFHSSQLFTGAIHCYNNALSRTIPFTLGELVNLKSVRLHNNNLTGMIPASLGNLYVVQTLSFFNNRLSGQLPKELVYLDQLITLNLGQNGLKGTIPREFGAMRSLREIYLQDNDFQGTLPKEFAKLHMIGEQCFQIQFYSFF